jgi:uncharacterized membrane protein
MEDLGLICSMKKYQMNPLMKKLQIKRKKQKNLNQMLMNF